MKTKSFLVQIGPQCFQRRRTLAIFGPQIDGFAEWMHAQRYTNGTICCYLQAVPKLIGWLRHRRISLLSHVTQELLQTALEQFRGHPGTTVSGVRALALFLRERQIIAEGRQVPAALSCLDAEVKRFEAYLCETRGLARCTISAHSRVLCRLLKYLNFERNPSCLARLQLGQIEAFLRKSAKTNNPYSVRCIVATIRSYLGWQYAQALLTQPLHQRIDTPRVYRQERPPRAIPWNQIQALLRSIDRSEPSGLRDFTMLYVAATYGLRCGELVRLTLDDIDWRARILRVMQTKTKQTIQLPLTDESANVLIAYLRKSRPESTHRQLFLHRRAPHGPLLPRTFRRILEHHRRQSGLKLPHLTTHVLRHSFAAHLMRQGVAMKTIGDTLGHRNTGSTSVYLRLHLDDLRRVGAPVPSARRLSTPLILVNLKNVPRIRPAIADRHLPANFHSRFATSLQHFVEFKRGLGCIYSAEPGMLRHWDHFMACQYPQVRRVQGEMFNAWTKTLTHVTSSGSRRYQRIIRNFLLFHARDHAGTFIPNLLTFPKAGPVVSPRLISDVEMGCVLEAARELPPSHANPLRAETFRIGFILLFCCGLRQGELLRLRLGDISEDHRVVDIRLTKFRKSRLVPLPPSVTNELEKYLRQRRQKKTPTAPDAFLMWSRRHSPEVYSSQALADIWIQLCVSSRVLNLRGNPPRLHDIRHHSERRIIPSGA